MNRLEIIEKFENEEDVSYEKIHPYLRSLYIYYKAQFCCEPVLMVTAVFNAVQTVQIVPENEFTEAIECYVNSMDLTDPTEREHEKELINFQSKYLIDLLPYEDALEN